MAAAGRVYFTSGRGNTVVVAAAPKFEVLSRKPVSVWLRVLGLKDRMATNWETTGSFAYDYVRAIVLTHGHNDHINAAVPLRELVDAPIVLHRDDAMLWSAVWPEHHTDGEPGAAIEVAGHRLQVVHTPGHSPGCCCLYHGDSDTVFSGDTLFCGGPGATGRSYSDEPTILRSIRDRLLVLPDHTVVHTGHGDSTTIGAERARVLDRIAELGL